VSWVTLTVDDGLATMRLTRGDAGNAIDREWVSSFADAVAECVADTTIRAVLVTAEGRAFTVGGDLKFFVSHLGDLPAAMDDTVTAFHLALTEYAALRVPVVAAVQGPIAGGGIGVAFCADIVLIAPEAKFVCAFSELGLSGDGGGTWWLPRLVGPRRAAEMMLLNRAVSAEEAVAWGLATRVVPAEELGAHALSIARGLAAGPTTSLAHMKRLMRETWSMSLPAQLDAETEAMIDCAQTADAREGVDAFATRRPPNFGGT
jgi:2-(1,2-epoxy-1,2-dihydrophenyl)acetyl-CoA isomerase